MINYDDFEKIDIRLGRITEAVDFPEARKPAYKLTIDFGAEVGVKRSSAQLVHNYTKDELINKQVLCVVNLPPRRIGPFVSEVLTLGLPNENSECVLVTTDRTLPTGGKLY